MVEGERKSVERKANDLRADSPFHLRRLIVSLLPHFYNGGSCAIVFYGSATPTTSLHSTVNASA